MGRILHTIAHWFGWYTASVVSRRHGRGIVIAHRCDTCRRVAGAVEMVFTGPQGTRMGGDPRPDLEGDDDGGWRGDDLTMEAVLALLDVPPTDVAHPSHDRTPT